MLRNRQNVSAILVSYKATDIASGYFQTRDDIFLNVNSNCVNGWICIVLLLAEYGRFGIKMDTATFVFIFLHFIKMLSCAKTK